MRSIRTDGGKIVGILDALDKQDKTLALRPAERRYPYRMPALNIDLRQPGDSSLVHHSVPTRWLSRNAMGFLHGCFVHQQTLCTAQLISLYGTWTDVDGWVQQCSYIDANVHEVEMHFARGIELALYCPAATTRRVLLADPDTRRAVEQLFKLCARIRSPAQMRAVHGDGDSRTDATRPATPAKAVADDMPDAPLIDQGFRGAIPEVQHLASAGPGAT